MVERTLAGDHQVGAGERVVEADEVEHQVDARGQPRAEERQRTGPDATGRARAGRVLDVDAVVAAQHLRPAGPGPASSTVTSAAVAPFCGP